MKVKMYLRDIAVASSLVVGFGLVASAAAHAELIATPVSGDTRLVQFEYDEDNTYLVLSKPKAATHLQFAADEMIQSVVGGDTAQWELSPTKNRKNLFIKPRYDDLETSLTVLTDKRAYQFVLRSTGSGKKWYQRVTWAYPQNLVIEDDAANAPMPAQDSMVAAGVPNKPSVAVDTTSNASNSSTAMPKGINPSSIKFGYETTGDAPFKPVTVFDDGTFTYLKMPPDLQELPALFAVVEGEQYALVNYTVDGDFIIAQRLMTEAVLKIGKKEVHVKKKPPRTFLGFKVGNE